MNEYAKTSHTLPTVLLQQAEKSWTELSEKTASLPINEDENPIKQYKQAILHAFACSDFITRIALQYPENFIQVLPKLVTNNSISLNFYLELASELDANMQNCENDTIAFSTIRQFRHMAMLCIAWSDFHKKQSIETSLLATSKIANLIVCAAYHYVYSRLVERYGSPKNKQQLLILSMGKLGGEELNFSSDIDLIFTYPSNGETENGRKPIEHQVFFTKLAQKLIQLLDNVTQDGQVYIVDMRLRPLGDSGPLVLPFSAMENYYQEQGRQWERFAMQKMRIVNDTPWNKELYDIIRPFVYRKYIDFTTIESIREMKHLIEQEVRRRQISDNIKLGKGGIRELEFFIQSIQLIHAGRHPDCQVTSILSSMHVLNKNGLLSNADHLQLKQDYLLLRQVEHYLQAFNDKQTQSLPLSDHEILNLNTAINPTALTSEQKEHWRLQHLIPLDQNGHTYKEQIKAAMHRINQVFASIVEDPNTQQTSASEQNNNQLYNDLWQLNLNQEEFVEALSACSNASSSQDLFNVLSKFKKKVERSGVSPRALKSINRLLPLLLSEFEVYKEHFEKDQIDGVFQLLATISGRVTYIDLLLEHPEVRARLLLLCKKSPWISQQIAQYPLLLDELLHPLYLDTNEISLSQWKDNCSADLRQVMLRVDLEDVELVMDTLRTFKHTNQLRIAAADISGTLAINQVSDKLTLLAEVLIHQVIDYAWRQIAHNFGQPQSNANNEALSMPQSKNFALVAYGKFGGIELSYGSDLDLVFLHNADLSQSTDNTGCKKQISNQEFYIKLVQRIVHLCTTKTYSGILYDIDLRLRPSGNSGLLVSHVDTFSKYQLESAWTWEHQALVRSRIISSDSVLAEQFTQIRNSIIALPRNELTLKQEVHEMREKMREHLLQNSGEKIDLKHVNGGIVDVEFLVQFWVLLHAQQYSELCAWSDNLRLLETLSEVGVISSQESQNLCKAYLRMRYSSHRLQLANLKFARKGASLENAMKVVNNKYQEVLGLEA